MCSLTWFCDASSSSKTISCSSVPSLPNRVVPIGKLKCADVCIFMPIDLYRHQMEMYVEILRQYCVRKDYEEGDNIQYFDVVPVFPTPEVVLALSFIFQKDTSKWSRFETCRVLIGLCRAINTPAYYDWQNHVSKLITAKIPPHNVTLSELKEFVGDVSETITPVSPDS